jgi:predicted DNA-binding transcriptional regulator AlpA
MAPWTDFLDPEEPDGAYLPWKRVEARVGISRTTAWRLQRSGDFPRPYVVSPGRVAYKESEVEAWKASRGHRAQSQALTRPGPAAARALPSTAVAAEPGCIPEAGRASAAPSAAPATQIATARARPTPCLNRRHGDGRQITFDF